MPEPAKREYWIGFDLGGTKMLAAVFDGKFRKLGSERKKTKGREGQEAGVARMERTIDAALVEAGVTPEQLAGIGIGAPGPLDLEEGVILDTPNLGWKNVPLKQTLQKRYGCPVVLCNDVDSGVYGEYVRGAGKKARCLLGIFPGTGVGGGCVYKGKLITGGSRSCLEIGHVPVVPDGALCGCGQRGCLETVASRLAIASAAAAAAFRGEAPHLLAKAGTDLANIRSGVLATAITEGDAVVEQIVHDAAWWLGVGAAGAVNLLAPDVVLLGGGLVEAMPNLFRDTVEEVLKERVMKAFRKSFQVVVAELGDDASIVGAAAWARQSTLEGSSP